jgi:hypothetical protein
MHNGEDLSMAAFATTRTLWQYTSDQGKKCLYRAQTGYTSQVAILGGAAADGTEGEPKRYGLKIRCAICKTAGGVKRRVPIFTQTAYAAIVVGTTSINVNVAETATAATVVSLEGERHRGAGLTN